MMILSFSFMNSSSLEPGLHALTLDAAHVKSPSCTAPDYRMLYPCLPQSCVFQRSRPAATWYRTWFVLALVERSGVPLAELLMKAPSSASAAHMASPLTQHAPQDLLHVTLLDLASTSMVQLCRLPRQQHSPLPTMSPTVAMALASASILHCVTMAHTSKVVLSPRPLAGHASFVLMDLQHRGWALPPSMIAVSVRQHGTAAFSAMSSSIHS